MLLKDLTKQGVPERLRYALLKDGDGMPDGVRVLNPGESLRHLRKVDWWLLAMPVGMLLFWMASRWWHVWDPYAAVPDSGVLLLFLLFLLAIGIIRSLTGWLTNTAMATLETIGKQQVLQPFKQLQAWQQITCYLACYLSFFWGLVLVLTKLF